MSEGVAVPVARRMVRSSRATLDAVSPANFPPEMSRLSVSLLEVAEVLGLGGLVILGLTGRSGRLHLMAALLGAAVVVISLVGAQWRDPSPPRLD